MQLSELYEIASSQRLALGTKDTGYPRDILPTLPQIQSHALIISGIRRCGKSTLLHQFVQQEEPFFYLNFDDLRLLSFETADYALLDKVIAESTARLLFFDEIQQAPHWELYIRQKLDEGFRILITGSNASLLSRELGTMLTGRHLTKELFPFSYREYCGFTQQAAGPDSLDAYLEKGGFPEYLKTDNDEVLSHLWADLLYRDIAVRYGIRDVTSLERLSAYLLSNPAQLTTPSRLNISGGAKSATTMLEYFSYFESAYLIHQVPCFAWSLKAQSLAPKKVYIADSGLIKAGSVAFNGNYGALLENFVFTSLRLYTRDIFYFSQASRTQDGECDFIVNSRASSSQPTGAPKRWPLCIQVTRELGPENEEREVRGLLAAMNFFELDQGIILTRNSEDLINIAGKRIQVTPAWKFDWAQFALPSPRPPGTVYP
jgi:predicted AAA+ superfamily ATPase